MSHKQHANESDAAGLGCFGASIRLAYGRNDLGTILRDQSETPKVHVLIAREKAKVY